MGSDTGQDVEKPVHRVWVDGFAMARTQVTNEEYGRFLQATHHGAPPLWNDPNFNHAQQPVVAISWFDAVAYCEWLSSMTAEVYRLPTEAEWERAARGGLDGNLFPWGNEPPQSRPGYSNRWKIGPEPVGQSEPNAYGVHEMCENVHEWCSDWFAADYYAISPDRNPRGPEKGDRKASRGGSWRHHIKISRCSTRSSIPPAFHYADYGFRVVRELSLLSYSVTSVSNIRQSIARTETAAEQSQSLGILVHGDNHFVVRGPLPSRSQAFALVHHWSVIQIGKTTPTELSPWRISSKEFREGLQWAVVVPANAEMTAAVKQLIEELSSRGIRIYNAANDSW
jgi:hypothetical protein